MATCYYGYSVSVEVPLPHREFVRPSRCYRHLNEMRKNEHKVGSSITVHLKHADGWTDRHDDPYMRFVFSWILCKDNIITIPTGEKVKYA
jgi:hypothetical protein